MLNYYSRVRNCFHTSQIDSMYDVPTNSTSSIFEYIDNKYRRVDGLVVSVHEEGEVVYSKPDIPYSSFKSRSKSLKNARKVE
jgi:hypothetical protein